MLQLRGMLQERGATGMPGWSWMTLMLQGLLLTMRPQAPVWIRPAVTVVATMLVWPLLRLLRGCARAVARALQAIAWRRCRNGLLRGSSIFHHTLGSVSEAFLCFNLLHARFSVGTAV